MAAGVVVILLASLALMAIVHHRHDRRVLRSSLGAFALVLFQALLGMVVVKLELEAVSVVLHLGAAMSLLALLIYLNAGLFAGADHPTDATISRRASVAAASVLFLLLVGSYVSGTGAGLAFRDWPLMNGTVLPELSVTENAIHFFHRALALVVGIVVFGVGLSVTRRKTEMPGAARLAHIAMGLFAVEVLIGAANVWTRLNAAAVTAHLATGAAIWATLVGLAAVTHPGVASRAPREVAGRRVAEASS